MKNKGRKNKGSYIIVPVILIAVSLILVALGLMLALKPSSLPEADNMTEALAANPELGKEFLEKAKLINEKALTDNLRAQLGDAPAAEAGYAVFFSVCDGTKRASVYNAVGDTLNEAWENALIKTEDAVSRTGLEPRWVKADIVSSVKDMSLKELKKEVKDARSEFYRFGVAFDPEFKVALLEEEMNGAKIYEYEDGGIIKKYLDRHLERSGRPALPELPENLLVFRCRGWFCDENSEVFELEHDELNYGRRKIQELDDEFIRELILSSSEFLMEQVNEDGSFVYGYYPRFDNEMDSYNIVRHVSTIWSLLCRYRMEPDENLKNDIDKTIEFALDNIIEQDDKTAYIVEKKSDEIKLGGCGMTVVALTEYMDVFDTDEYKELCCKLGEGILKLLDQKTGKYYHVLNTDFSPKEEFRTVYYDGEATFALARLYGLTGEDKWLEAACSAINHFIEADYTQYRDHWVAYSLNEVTKYIPDNSEFNSFALANAQNNYERLCSRESTGPTYLELLMGVFNTCRRMEENGIETGNFNKEGLLEAIYTRVYRQMEGYFFPEFAMYMENPERILDSFMVRNDGFRVRIDDVQHNIGGLYQYILNYDELIKAGMSEDMCNLRR